MQESQKGHLSLKSSPASSLMFKILYKKRNDVLGQESKEEGLLGL